jgi:hypothetical protein
MKHWEHIMNTRYILGTVILSASLAAASTASAATINLQAQSDVNPFLDADDANPLLVMSDYTVGTTTIPNSAIGAYRVKAELFGAAADFLAFCLEPLENFALPAPYERLNKFGVEVTTHLNMLAENAMSLVQSHETAAAFQMAAWEITTENASVFDIDDGFFQVAGGSQNSDDAKDIAQEWLDNIQDDFWAAPSSSYMILSADGTQDLLTSVVISTVPLPATGLMMATALFGAGGIAARRRRVTRQA